MALTPKGQGIVVTERELLAMTAGMAAVATFLRKAEAACAAGNLAPKAAAHAMKVAEGKLARLTSRVGLLALAAGVQAIEGPPGLGAREARNVRQTIGSLLAPKPQPAGQGDDAHGD